MIFQSYNYIYYICQILVHVCEGMVLMLRQGIGHLHYGQMRFFYTHNRTRHKIFVSSTGPSTVLQRDQTYSLHNLMDSYKFEVIIQIVAFHIAYVLLM